MLQVDITKRLTVDQIAKHPWISKQGNLQLFGQMMQSTPPAAAAVATAAAAKSPDVQRAPAQQQQPAK
jgi:TRAP-type uncharacterized transport system fused permease subunit